MATLKVLREKQKVLNEQFSDVNREIQKIEDEKNLPSIKEKYEGKYFKMSSGCDFEVWPIYFFCKKVKNNKVGVFDAFQIANYYENMKRYQFEENVQWHLQNIYNEITQEEYEAELVIFKNKLCNLNDEKQKQI